MDAQQRGKFLEMMLVELAQRGYGDASVERAMRASETPPSAFESEFADKDECLFAAYDLLTERVVEKAVGGCDGGEDWPDRVRAGLLAVLRELAAEPEMAKVMVRSFPSIRPSCYERYVHFLGRFLPYMKEGRTYSGLAEDLPAEVELLAVGAAESIIFSELDAGRADRLPSLMPEILFSVLVPFIGPDRAADAMRSASAAL